MTHTENRFPLFAYERNGKCKLSPLVGESVSGADERGKCGQKRKKVFYRTTLNTCPSFLNESNN